jgi:cell division protein FtsA
MSDLLPKGTYTALIDIGHSKSRLVILAPDFSSMRVFEEPTTGFQKGKVTNSQSFTDTLHRLISRSSLFNSKYSAIVNIPSIQTRTLVQTVHHRSNGVYRSSDHQAIVNAAVDSAAGGLDEVIDAQLLQVKIDEKTIDPLAFGTDGREISAQVILATHPSLVLADILNCVNSAGIEVSEFRSNGFGLMRSLKSLRPSAENCVLIDIGHSTTTGAIMIGGAIHQIFCVPAGGAHMSKDVAAGLATDFERAEATKISFGLHERSTEDASAPQIQRFLRPRVAEIVTLASKHFAIYSRSLDGGLLFCGNASLLTGLSSFTQQLLRTHPPFVCQLTNKGAETFVGIRNLQSSAGDENTSSGAVKIDSGWVSVLAHARSIVLHHNAMSTERQTRPLARLNPLWTWLSELSR